MGLKFVNFSLYHWKVGAMKRRYIVSGLSFTRFLANFFSRFLVFAIVGALRAECKSVALFLEDDYGCLLFSKQLFLLLPKPGVKHGCQQRFQKRVSLVAAVGLRTVIDFVNDIYTYSG